MSLQTIDAKTLSRMFLAGAKNLESKKEWINELNVFPVPDGDTGTNMTMTIMSAARELDALGGDAGMEAICKAISGGSLRGARGNSGVILSQLLRGFTKVVKKETKLGIPQFADAFEKAVETAYKAVMKPKEGTILTVSRGAAEKARELQENGCEDLEIFFRSVIEQAEYVLSQTPEMLPVLKQAGVVDSGGQGLVEVLHGAFDLYLGKEIDLTLDEAPAGKHADAEGGQDEPQAASKLKYGYGTEFTVLLTKSFHQKMEKDFRAFLEATCGDVACTADAGAVQVSVHTNDPGLVIQRALMYGELTNVKIENLRVKVSGEGKAAQGAAEEETGAAPEVPTEETPRKAVGFLAVSVGDGVNEIFRSLGVDYIIEGGQTMNPSTADILDAVEHVNADTIFVLPNNKNIILAANQAAELMADKTLLVIPTKTIPQGITAVINYVPEMSVDENEQTMIAEIANVKTGQVTYAVRDTVIDDKEIKKDDYMGIGDQGILTAGPNIDEVTTEMAAAMVDETSELISIYYGADVSDADAEALRDTLSKQYPECDIELQNGGQPIYYYIISVE